MATSEIESDPADAITQLPDLVNGDDFLVHRGRFLTVDFLVEIGDAPFMVSIEKGRVASVERGPFPLRPYAFAVRGTVEGWQQFWLAIPPPQSHDILALVKRGEFCIEGDLHPFMANLLYIKDVLAAPRQPQTEPAANPVKPVRDSMIEPITGRYIHLTLGGRDNRVYFEEAGQGIPLVCLHTAGADGRQYRHLMIDEAITDNFRVIAFDLPWHGKTLPPAGWNHETYQLTVESYVEVIRAFCQALELDRPAVIGCSIGGRIVVKLAIDHAAEFRALIGLEASDYQPPWGNHSWASHHPNIHGGEASAGMVSGMMAPQSPEETRWETLWQYMCSGPGVFKGDRFPYDFRDQVASIDTDLCPLFLLTGDYDFTVPPETTRKIADKVPGAEFTVMTEMGHFCINENPARFREYLLPVLDRIRTAS
jgi:pimeloyl-ACP methyl ester carboxylesterase